MTGPDPHDLLALDEALPVVPAGFGPRVRQAALARRRRRLAASAAVGALAVAGVVAVAVPLGAGGEETLTPAPRATQPVPEPTASPTADPAGEGLAVPVLDVPPCVNPPGYGRIYGVPGQSRGPERLQDSVQEDTGQGSGFIPEVEQALVDTAPAGVRIDCAKAGTVVFLAGQDGSYVEIYTSLNNPLVPGPPEDYFDYSTAGGAQVALDSTVAARSQIELYAGRYRVSMSARVSEETGAGVPLEDMRGWADRLGPRLMMESESRGTVPVEMLDRTPNPPPQQVVDLVLAAAPDGAELLGFDKSSTSQGERVAVLHPDGRAAALAIVFSTANPQQTSPLDLDTIEQIGARVEDEYDGWPSGVLVGVNELHRQILIQHEDVFLNFTADDPDVVSPARLRAWAMDVASGLS